MTFLYRFVVFIAAILAILLTLNLFAIKYEIEPRIEFQSKAPTAIESFYYDDSADKTSGVPSSAVGQVTIPTDELDHGSLYRFERTPWMVFPVIHTEGDERQRFRNFFSSSGVSLSQDTEELEFFEGGGECDFNVVNIVAINENANEKLVAFDERVLLPVYVYYYEAGKQTVAALAISEDTNGNGLLDCGDRAEFRLVGLGHDLDKRTDIDIVAENIIRAQFNRDGRMLLSARSVDADGVKHIEVMTIDYDTLEITERVISDYIGDAQAAFDNIAEN